ncbi:site-specific integrase [candidate division KSB1 bacterium]|nr:site-specific integrase [candidate division KSB1 bacterium]
MYTNDEIASLRDILSKGPRWQLDIFNLALWTGGRVQELLNLKEADLTLKNFDNLGIINLLTFRGKSNKIRQVPIGPNATELLKERIFILGSPDRIQQMLNRHRKELQEKYYTRATSGYIFFEVLRRWAVGHAFKAALREAGLEDGKFHDLRKTFATYSLEDGLTIEAVSGTLGHSDISITQKAYAEKTLMKLILESKMRTEK